MDNEYEYIDIKMNEPLISVLLPIYNVEKYLEKCMDSLLNQTYKNLEIIMIDDGATDSCPNMCDSYKEMDNRIKVYHKKNGGLSDARNYGIERATGEYITYVDPDDYVDSDYIDYLYKLAVKYDSKMSVCQSKVHYNNGKIKERGSTGAEVIGAEKCIERMLYHDVIDTSAWGKLYRRDLFDGVLYPEGKLFEDMGTTYKLMMKCDNIAVGYESKYHYIFHNNSIANGLFKPSKMDLLEMTDEMAENVSQKYPELADATLRRRVYARLSTINQMLNTNGYEHERNEMISFVGEHRKAILKNPKSPKRDKIAVILLAISYRLYRLCWLTYRSYIMQD